MEIKKKAAPTSRNDSSSIVSLGGSDTRNHSTPSNIIKGLSFHPRELKSDLEGFLNHYELEGLSKRKRVLAWLLVSSTKGAKVTRFDAEWVNDHCFNTTVSEIQSLDGISVQRTTTKRPCAFGETNCKEYWLSDHSIYKASKLLGVSDG